MITFSHNLDRLNAILPEYKKASGLTTSQVLVKQATKLTFELRDRLRRLKPGGITADRISALRSGEGIKVRESIIRSVMAAKGASVRITDRLRHTGGNTRRNASIYGSGTAGVVFGKRQKSTDTKGRSLWNLIVKREISARESGKGYTSTAGMMRVRNLPESKFVRQFGRLNQELSTASLKADEKSGLISMRYGGSSHGGKDVSLGEALRKPRAQSAIAEALDAVRKDIGVYLARKHRDALQSAVDKATSYGRRIAT